MALKTISLVRTASILVAVTCGIAPDYVGAQFRDVTPGVATANTDSSTAHDSQEKSGSKFAKETNGDETAPEPIAADPPPPPKTKPKQALLPAAEPATSSGATPPTPDTIEGATETANSEVAQKESELAQLIETELIDDRSLRALKFRGVMVGETTEEEVVAKWGEPFKVVEGDGLRIIKYRMPPFRQVDLTFADGRAIAVLIHLYELQDPFHVANELRMTSLEPVPIPDEFGNVMGMAYPERGVLLGFDVRDPESLVAKIQIEPITAEPFVLRAEYDFDRKYEQNLADIDQALELNPNYAQAHWAKAKVCAAIGRYQDAMKSIKLALKEMPKDFQMQLTKAQIRIALGQSEEAQNEVAVLLEGEDVPREVRAEASNIFGDALVIKQPGKFNDAMKHHLKAIELAAPLANDARFNVRRLSKRTLVRAHLAVAQDISLGDFQRQLEIVPKWLSRARALAEEYIRRDQGDRKLRLDVQRSILATAADLRYPDSPKNVIDDLLQEGHALIARAEDPRNRARLQWELGTGIAEAVRLQRLRGEYDEALELADEAVELLQLGARQRQATEAAEYLVGRLYFQVGSLNAVHRKEHREAIAWYEKAESLVQNTLPPPTLADLATHGEMYVSMGVSHWESGEQQQAINLTETGTNILQKGVVDGILLPIVLQIPYSNLASMHQQAGHEQEAKAFADLAKTIDQAKGNVKSR
jgi:tetratricopeptide (TPR) repeat protein